MIHVAYMYMKYSQTISCINHIVSGKCIAYLYICTCTHTIVLYIHIHIKLQFISVISYQESFAVDLALYSQPHYLVTCCL